VYFQEVPLRRDVVLAIFLAVGGLLAAAGRVSAQGPDGPVWQPAEPSLEIQIVGGQTAGPGEYPWQVALVAAGFANPLNGQFCGGSLIDDEWVLTAAHCVVESGQVTGPAEIDVVVGINNLSDGPTSGSQGQRIDVAEILVHPDYNSATTDQDIALLRLANPATLNATVATIIPAGPENAALFEAGDTATITGWGATAQNGGGSDALLEVSVPIVSNATCNAPTAYDGEITANMLCAGLAEGGKDSCYGDSGGPLIVPDGGGGWLQAGIVSWGYGCAQPNAYGVYTRLSNYKSWIAGLITETPTFTPTSFIYLPVALARERGDGNGDSCTPDPPGDSDNIADARTVCSGQTISGQVSAISDRDDVYKIYLESGQRLTLSMTGSGDDADLYLYPPGSTDVWSDTPAAFSENEGNNETIDGTVFTTGYWYIDIYAYSGSSSFQVVVTVQ
jgi:hypothetical protein